jgi:hypothetical protein
LGLGEARRANAGTLARDKKQAAEVRSAAKVVESANANGRRVQVIPHPREDIIDLLDEHAITDLYPDFPGHRKARAAAQKARDHSRTHPKDFYKQAYGIGSDVETFKHISGEMKRQGVPWDEAFHTLVAICRRLSLTMPGPPG